MKIYLAVADTTSAGKAKHLKLFMEQQDLIGSPTVRLVANGNAGREEAKAQALGAPTVRLVASSDSSSAERQTGALGPSVRLVNFDIPAVHSALSSPTVRLAHQPDSQCDNATKEGGWRNTGAPLAQEPPGLLISYYYLEPFLNNKDQYRYRDWVMDSGAFSAHNSGATIDLQKYIDVCLELLATDPTLTEVFALDKIPTERTPLAAAKAAEVSLKNAEEMWRQGIEAIPCFHAGEPEEFLYAIAKQYPKIALGGVALERGDFKFQFCEQCFARVWPKKIHGFGMSSEKLVYGLPFHSVDATNWEIAPCAFGNWEKFGQMSVRGSNQDLRSQVKHYANIEAKARVRWEKEMALLEQLFPTKKRTVNPTVRLAVDAGAADGQRVSGAIGNGITKVKPAKAEQSPKPAKQEPKAKALTGELDDKWKRNWWE